MKVTYLEVAIYVLKFSKNHTTTMSLPTEAKYPFVWEQ